MMRIEILIFIRIMSTASMMRVISETSQMVDYFEEERDRIEKKKMKIMSKEPIDKEIFKQGLSNIGRTHENSRFAYLNLNLSNKNLVSVCVIFLIYIK